MTPKPDSTLITYEEWYAYETKRRVKSPFSQETKLTHDIDWKTGIESHRLVRDKVVKPKVVKVAKVKTVASKNLMGKTRTKENAYSVVTVGDWKWYILKHYQSPEKEATNPHARVFCWVESPYCGGGEFGDTYLKDIGRTF